MPDFGNTQQLFLSIVPASAVGERYDLQPVAEGRQLPFVFFRSPASQTFSEPQFGTACAAVLFSADQPLSERGDQEVVAELPGNVGNVWRF